MIMHTKFTRPYQSRGIWAWHALYFFSQRFRINFTDNIKVLARVVKLRIEEVDVRVPVEFCGLLAPLIWTPGLLGLALRWEGISRLSHSTKDALKAAFTDVMVKITANHRTGLCQPFQGRIDMVYWIKNFCFSSLDMYPLFPKTPSKS